MEQQNKQEELDQESEINSINQQPKTNEQAADNRYKCDENGVRNPTEAVSQSYNYSQSQLHWMNKQVCNLERELLLNNNSAVDNNFMSNWTKVILSALAVIIPGIGQIIGIIVGLVFVSNDVNADRRSYGAALLTVSVVTFIISAGFWFIFALTFGPQLYY